MSHLHVERALLPTGWAENVRLTIDGTRFSAVDIGVAPHGEDEQHAIAVPGMPNLHSHAFQRGMAGLAERAGPSSDSFWTWREEMYRFLRVLDPDDVAAIAAMAYAEMLEGGFTRVGEFHYLHHAPDGGPYEDIAEMACSIARAASSSGIGLTLLPCFYAHSGFGGLAPHEGQKRFINDLDGFAALLERSRRAIRDMPAATIGIAPHSLRAVTPAEIATLVSLVPAGPFHIHAAEQVKEVEDCLAWSGKRPVEWLLQEHGLDHRWCLIHSTHMTEDETASLARTGAVAGLCPITEANLGDGIFNGAGYHAKGGRLGIGTDSNISIGAGEELRQLEYAQRLGLRLRNVMAKGPGVSTGRTLFDSALAGGSQALAVNRGGREIGIQVGASADVVTLDKGHAALVHRRGDALLDAWIFVAGREAVDTVWCLGRKRVVNGRHIERTRIERAFSRVIGKVLTA